MFRFAMLIDFNGVAGAYTIRESFQCVPVSRMRRHSARANANSSLRGNAARTAPPRAHRPDAHIPRFRERRRWRGHEQFQRVFHCPYRSYHA